MDALAQKVNADPSTVSVLVEEVSVCIFSMFSILFFSDQHTLWSRCSFTDAKSAMVRRDDSNSSGVRAGPLFLGRRRSGRLEGARSQLCRRHQRSVGV